MLRPAELDPHFLVNQGSVDKSYYDALINNLPSNPYGDGKYHPEYVDYATVAIGLYAASSGMSRDEILRIEWRVALGLGALLLALLATVLARTWDEDTCEHAIVARLPSPDGAWEARVDEATCLVGLGGIDITAGVHLVSTRDPARFAVLLGVDTGGHEDERQRLAWTAPDILQVTVYHHSYLKVLTR